MIVPSLPVNETVYTVSRLNAEAKNLLQDYFFRIQVEGEISNLSQPSSGHLYFSLKDAQSQVRCAMFRPKVLRNRHCQIKNGLKVIVTADVSLYEARGDYQLIVEQIHEAGQGQLQMAFEALKHKLSEEGLFTTDRKQSLPALPTHIAVVTSPTGAAIRDILSVLKRRFPAIPVTLYPTSVQGENAKHDICRSLKQANQQANADVIILARGGGSLEDLWPFNEECVARAIAGSHIPVITGVGHETDITIADWVADLRAPTPSAAAEAAVPDQTVWLKHFQGLEKNLHTQLRRQLLQHRQQCNSLSKRLGLQHPEQRLQRLAQGLDHLEIRLQQVMSLKLHQHRQKLERQHQQLWRHNPTHRITRLKLIQNGLQERLIHLLQHRIISERHRLSVASQTLNAVSPLGTLARGYALVTDVKTGQLITDSASLQTGQQLKTQLAQGQFISEIKTLIP
jgi:exodeoxyribonuclease VII large subunit